MALYVGFNLQEFAERYARQLIVHPSGPVLVDLAVLPDATALLLIHNRASSWMVYEYRSPRKHEINTKPLDFFLLTVRTGERHARELFVRLRVQRQMEIEQRQQ